jgi:hypothetical protein
MWNEIAAQKILDVSTYTKAPDWSYENEWQSVTFKRPTDSGHFADYKRDRRELAPFPRSRILNSGGKFRRACDDMAKPCTHLDGGRSGAVDHRRFIICCIVSFTIGL